MVRMRFSIHYNCVIRLIAAVDALYISAPLTFQISHPRFRVPWEEIELGRSRTFWRRYVFLTLGSEEQIPMRISERMARNLGILDRIPDGSGPSEPSFTR